MSCSQITTQIATLTVHVLINIAIPACMYRYRSDQSHWESLIEHSYPILTINYTSSQHDRQAFVANHGDSQWPSRRC